MCAKAVFKHSQKLLESDQQRWNKGRPLSSSMEISYGSPRQRANLKH